MCGHAFGTPSDYCEQALKANLRGIVFTEHNPMPASYGHAGRIPKNQIEAYRSLIRRTAKQYKQKLNVLTGLECDYLPEYESVIYNQITKHQFSYVVGSVHCQLPAFRRHTRRADPKTVLTTYLEIMAQAAESGLFDTIAHPHLGQIVVGNDAKLPKDKLESFLDRIAATGVSL